MPFNEGLEAFFDAAEFATTGTLAGVAVLGIFDRPSAQAGLGLIGAAATRPTYLLPTTQAGATPVGLTLVVSGVGTFVVAESRPDGTGLTMLELELP